MLPFCTQSVYAQKITRMLQFVCFVSSTITVIRILVSEMSFFKKMYDLVIILSKTVMNGRVLKTKLENTGDLNQKVNWGFKRGRMNIE